MIKWTKADVLNHITGLISPFENSQNGQKGIKPSAAELMRRAKRRAVLRGIKPRLVPTKAEGLRRPPQVR